MSTTSIRTATSFDVQRARDAVYRDGITGIPGAFPASWAQRLREDYEPLMVEARNSPDGTVSRGPQRFYHAVHPERLRGFVELITHPAFTGLATAMLGDDYLVAEVGFDTPLPGARDQPWHRDFPMTSETRVGRWLSALAFNVTTVAVTDELGPFEIVPGSHWDEGTDFAHGMFPPASHYPAYQAGATRRYPQLGDMSCRTGLAIHRGTAHRGSQPRPVLVVGVVAAVIPPAAGHHMHMTRRFFGELPAEARRNLRVTLVDELPPLVQSHDIEGFMMG